MSKADLEEYWRIRDDFFSESLAKAAVREQGKMKEFIALKEKTETELRKKDDRAYRAVQLSAHVALGESELISKDLYPNEKTRPALASMFIGMKAQKKLCMAIYDMLLEMALDAAKDAAPTEEPTTNA